MIGFLEKREMGKSAPDPQPPVIVNPGATAGQQATFNRDTALQQRALNMVDQRTPQGSLTYEPTGTERVEGIPDYRAKTEMSPEQQGLYDTGIELSSLYGSTAKDQLTDVSDTLRTAVDFESLGAAPDPNEAYRTQIINSMLARHQPQADRDRQALETSLANQGFVVGSENYNSAMDERNRAETDFSLAAQAAGGNEMSRMYGLEAGARDKRINEMLMQRNVPLTELAALTSGVAPSSPSFVPTPQGQIAAPDFMGAAYGSANQQNIANQQQYAAQTGDYQAGLQGLYGMGAAGLGGWGRSGFKWA